jgi:hypothetical protein
VKTEDKGKPVFGVIGYHSEVGFLSKNIKKIELAFSN